MSEMQWAWGMQGTKRKKFGDFKADAKAKKQREEEEAAMVYADFVESFDGPGKEAPKFVTGESISQGVSDVGPKVSASSGQGSRYVPGAGFSDGVSASV